MIGLSLSMRCVVVTWLVAGFASLAQGQSIAYDLSVQNLTQGTPRGTLLAANQGDVCRIWVSAHHSGLSVGSAGFSIELYNFAPLPITESATAGFDLTDNLVGRHPHMRNPGSDRAPGAAQGARSIVVNDLGMNHWTITDDTGDWIDLATLPPTANPLIGLFPISSGEQFFAFDVVLAPRMGHGIYSIELHHRPSGRLYRNSSDSTGVEVVPSCGVCYLFVPAPGALAPFAALFAASGRRRG